MEEPCPEGLVFVEGKCTAPTSDKAHQCEPSNQDECAQQCDKGHAGSCGALGFGYLERSHDYGKALAAFQKGCEGGDARACVNRGEMTLHGLGTNADPAAAAPLFESACNQGDAIGCGDLGRLVHAGTGVAHDDARAATLLRKSCDGGQAPACGELGSMTRDGAGVPKDDKAATALIRRGCDGSDARSCNTLGLQLEASDTIAAGIAYQRGCFGDGKDAGEACAGLGRIAQAGLVVDNDRAKRAYEMACDKQNVLGCAALKVAYGGTRVVTPDVPAQAAMQKACDGGQARACAILGVMQAAEGMPGGKQSLDRACKLNDKWACAMNAKVH
jgi:TPR repeat protein